MNMAHGAFTWTAWGYCWASWGCRPACRSPPEPPPWRLSPATGAPAFGTPQVIFPHRCRKSKTRDQNKSDSVVIHTRLFYLSRLYLVCWYIYLDVFACLFRLFFWLVFAYARAFELLAGRGRVRNVSRCEMRTKSTPITNAYNRTCRKFANCKGALACVPEEQVPEIDSNNNCSESASTAHIDRYIKRTYYSNNFLFYFICFFVCYDFFAAFFFSFIFDESRRCCVVVTRWFERFEANAMDVKHLPTARVIFRTLRQHWKSFHFFFLFFLLFFYFYIIYVVMLRMVIFKYHTITIARTCDRCVQSPGGAICIAY